MDLKGGLKSKSARVLYTPIFGELSSKGGTPIVNAVLQFVGAALATKEESSLMHCLHRLLHRASAELRPTIDEANKYINHLSIITSRIENVKNVSDLEDFITDDFDDAFSTYCCSVLKADCALFRTSKANLLAGNLRATPRLWTQVGAVAAASLVSIPLETIDALSYPFNVSSQSLLSHGPTDAVYISTILLNEAVLDGSDSNVKSHLVVEKRTRPSFYEMNQMSSLIDLRRIIVLAAVSL
jgi:hypothetical protein